MPGPEITEERVRLGGIETLLRRTGGEGVPTLFVHGNPTHSADWLPFLAAVEGPAIAFDLPSFGRAERPPAGRFDGSMHAYARWIGTAIDELGIERFQLVAHDWGAVALHPAARRAERLERLVVINGVPLLAGYRWHWVARIWRTPGLGELLNATTTRPALAALLRQARPGLRPMPDEFVEMVWSCWDRGMARAVLRLYRSADPEVLEAAGRDLDRLACPALVLWGDRDPYLGADLGRRHVDRLPGAELEVIADAGHWPWIDRPEVVARVASFLSAR